MALSPGATGGNEAAAVDQLKSQGIANPSSGLVKYLAYGATDYSPEEAQQYGLPLTSRHTTELNEKAIAPAVSSLEASKGEVSTAYDIRGQQLAAEKDPLKQRYSDLMSELKRREGVDVSQTTTATAREYGKRGIPLSSGVYDQAVIEKTRPISEFYTGQTKEVGLAQENDLRDLENEITNLTQEKIARLRDIDNEIARLKAGGATSAITQALALYKTQEEREFQSRINQLQIKKYELDNASAQADLDTKESFRKLSDLEGQFGGIQY